MKIVWIRHAESLVNADYRNYLKQPDPALSAKGQAQALALASDPELKGVEHVIVSKLKRTQQTAELAFPKVPATISPTCREWVFGPPEMTDTEYKERLIETKEVYWHAETSEQVQKRCTAFYLELVQFSASHPTVTCVAIVSHASFIRAFTGQTLDNAGVYVIPSIVKPISSLPVCKYDYQFEVTNCDSQNLLFGTTTSGRELCVALTDAHVVFKVGDTNWCYQVGDVLKFEALADEIMYRCGQEPITCFQFVSSRLIQCPK